MLTKSTRVHRILASLLVFTLLFLSGCAETKKTEVVKVPEEKNTLHFALVTKEETNPYMNKLFEGFEEACLEIGAKATYHGPAAYSSEMQIAFIEELIADEVDAIAIAANHADALNPILETAQAKGIHIVSLDSSVNPESRTVHLQQASPEKVGRLLLQTGFEIAGRSGKAAIITSTQFASNQSLWVEWMRTEYDENPQRYKNFVLLDDQYGHDSYTITRDVTFQLLEDYPDLKVIITPSVVSMRAVGEVLKEKNSSVRYTGLGLPSEIAEYIESGSCPQMYLWNPIDLGYLAAYTCDAIREGKISGEVGDNFSAGRLGARFVDVSSDGGTEIVLGNPVKFDQENISQWKNVY